jgi:rare lipoprotein A (peptidoglycan hydrolase)
MRKNFFLILFLGIIPFLFVCKSSAASSYRLPVGASKEEYYFPSIMSKEEILRSLPQKIYPEDYVSFFPDPRLNLGTKLTIIRAFLVEVKDGAKTNRYRTLAPTVGQFLVEKEIELGEKDRIQPSSETPISNNLQIKITRVKETEIIIEKTIPKETVLKEDSSLEKGTEKVLEEGRDGKIRQVFLVRREDGIEVSRKLIRQETIVQTQKRIILKGTKLPLIAIGTATWYSAPPMTAAHKSLPKGTLVQVTNLSNNKSVQVKIADWGPVGAEIDLSKDAFEKIAPLESGRILVKIEKWIP